MFKRYFIAAAALALLSACSTTDNLDTSASNAGDASRTTLPGDSHVAPVQADHAMQEADGPAGVAKVIYFDFDSFVVKPEYQSVIDGHARHLQANRSRHDERGGREYNLALGQKRAEAVRRALGLVGASDAQIEAVSFGEEKPAVMGSDESAWSQNRRVEIKYR